MVTPVDVVRDCDLEIVDLFHCTRLRIGSALKSDNAASVSSLPSSLTAHGFWNLVRIWNSAVAHLEKECPLGRSQAERATQSCGGQAELGPWF